MGPSKLEKQIEGWKQEILDNRLGWEMVLYKGGREHPEKYGEEFCKMLEREQELNELISMFSGS